MKSKDIKVIISIIAVVALVSIIRNITAKDGQYIRISEDDRYIGTYPLDSDKIIALTNNTVEIKNGRVHMHDAKCPDKLCVNQGYIDKSGESIVCLPGKVVVSVTDSVEVTKVSGFYFNTYIEVTAYDCESDSVMNGILNICEKYEKICSRTDTSSELYRLNNRLLPVADNIDGINCYKISDELYEMIAIGLDAGSKTDGIFNIAIAPVSSLWNFTDGSKVLPSSDEIENALKYVSLDDIYLYPDNMIGFATDKNAIDLGGIAKGFIADIIKEYLLSNNVHSAIISLGHNILCIGDKLGLPFKVGIKMPFDDTKVITSVDIRDKSVVTSGIYERYFEIDEKIYHHILNPASGYPIDNDLSSVTIISDTSTEGDILSTYLFSLGKDGALNYDNTHDSISTIIINRDNKIVK